MTKRRAVSAPVAAVLALPVQRRFWVGLKVVAAASLITCIFAFLRIQSSQSGSLEADSRVSTYDSHFTGVPKVAFLFLARGDLPLDFLWHAFFQNGDTANFSIYIHSAPGFVFDKLTTRSPFFYGRQLKRSVKVAWGEASMIEAERLLFKTALEDPANQRFVLLSDSCAPLYNFSYVYNYLMSSSKSFVDSFVITDDKRYNPKMTPIILKDKWRKGSQWITLIRRHAEVVVTDNNAFPVFKKHCKRRPELDPKKKPNVEQHNCIPDEHYVQTLLCMTALDDELERRTLTYTSWNFSASNMDKKSWHPLTFDYADAAPQRIGQIKGIYHIYYESEYRTEWCQTNGTAVPCYLFARKFTKAAAMRLLSEGLVGRFDAAAVLSQWKPST